METLEFGPFTIQTQEIERSEERGLVTDVLITDQDGHELAVVIGGINPGSEEGPIRASLIAIEVMRGSPWQEPPEDPFTRNMLGLGLSHDEIENERLAFDRQRVHFNVEDTKAARLEAIEALKGTQEDKDFSAKSATYVKRLIWSKRKDFGRSAAREWLPKRKDPDTEGDQ